MQNGFFAGHDQGMSGIMSALETHHALCMIGQPINDFAFTFITPLRADHNYILGHLRYPVPYQIPMRAAKSALENILFNFPNAILQYQAAITVGLSTMRFLPR